jgi:hypothetical protein
MGSGFGEIPRNTLSLQLALCALVAAACGTGGRTGADPACPTDTTGIESLRVDEACLQRIFPGSLVLPKSDTRYRLLSIEIEDDGNSFAATIEYGPSDLARDPLMTLFVSAARHEGTPDLVAPFADATAIVGSTTLRFFGMDGNRTAEWLEKGTYYELIAMQDGIAASDLDQQLLTFARTIVQ